MSERAGDRDRGRLEGGEDGSAATERPRRRRSQSQSRASLALVVLAVAALVAGLTWRSGLLPGVGDDGASPSGSDGPPASESAPTATASDPSLEPTASPSPTPAETAGGSPSPSGSPNEGPSPTPTETPGESPDASPSESPGASPSEGPSPTPTSTATPQSGLTPGPTPASQTPSAKMSCVRHRSVAVKLADGRVLVASGCVSDNDGRDEKGNWVFGLADVFDPATGRFTQTGKMTTSRDLGAQALLADGRVFFVGGMTAFGGVDAAATEFYDPVIGRFVPGPRDSRVRGDPGLFLMNDGRMLVVGGDATDASSTDTAEIFDPAAGKFTPAGRLALEGTYGQISGAVLPDGRVFIMASVYSGKYLNAPQIYDPATNTFSATAAPAKPVDGWGGVALLPTGKVLLIGGNTDGPLQSYDPATNTFTKLASMPLPLNVSTATLLRGGKILVLGTPIPKGQLPWTGWSSSSAGLFDPRPAPTATDPSDSMTGPETIRAELYDPSTGRWTLLGTTAQPRAWYAFNTVALDDGRALIVGGSTNTGEIFDPKTNRFSLIK